MKKKILIMTAYYLPSVKGGGPIRSIQNLIENLSDSLDFYILTSDRDLGDNKPFENIVTDKWIKKDNIHILYTNNEELTYKKLANIIKAVKPNILYLNSFFSYNYSIKPIILNKLRRINIDQVVLAPRGEFSLGALSLKSRKKKMFIKVSNILRLYNDIRWHSTSKYEKKDILNNVDKTAEIVVANNLTTNYKKLKYTKNIVKKPGELSIVFVSRITPKKNLLRAIKLLTHIKGHIKFDIYGPIEDSKYWRDCQKAIQSLPENIKVSYCGVLKHEEVMEVFLKTHIFLFPTLGENYGHIISEALIGGCPIIISDQTPWRNLNKKGVGWDISLNDNKQFINAIRKFVSLGSEEYEKMSKKAFEYAKETSNTDSEIEATYALFK